MCIPALFRRDHPISLINAKDGNLKLDTETLTYENIKSRESGRSLGGGIEVAGTASPEYNSTLVDAPRNKKNNASGSSGGETGATPTSDEDKNLFDNMAGSGKKLKNKINKAKETVKNGALDAAGNLLDHRDIDIVIGWVGNGAGHVADAFEPVNDYLESMQTRPVDLSFGYSEKVQLATATIGAGEITIRSNPDQDISDLNRDPAKSFVVIDKPLFGIKSKTIRKRIEDIDIKDPAKSIRDGIGVARDTRDISNDIAKQGGIGNYLTNKGKSKKNTKIDND